MKILCRENIGDEFDLYVAGERNYEGAEFFEIKDRNGAKVGDDIRILNSIYHRTGLRVETSGFSDSFLVHSNGLSKQEVESML